MISCMDISDQLREARRLSGLTQDELAEHLGVDKASVHRWETGQRGPRGRNLRAVRKFIEDPHREPAKAGAAQDDRPPPLLSTDEQMLLDVWRRLDVIQKVEIMKTASAFLPSTIIGRIADELLGQAGPAPGAERKGTRP